MKRMIMNNRKRILTICLLLAAMAAFFMPHAAAAKDTGFKYEYGVFLGLNAGDTAKMKDYRVIVIEGQEFTKKQIRKLRKEGHTVYSYINLGALENYRPYYDKYEKYTLDVYENWEDEKWVDVSRKEWQDFLVKTLAKKLAKKGIDGLFVDNVDVYYHYHTDEVYDGITKILKGFKKQGMYVCINGGDVYVREYIKRNKKLGYIDAVNQESVYSAINWDKGTFKAAKKSDRKYFQKYAALVSKNGGDVYFLEYTKNKKLIKKIRSYCRKKGYRYYVSKSIALNG